MGLNLPHAVGPVGTSQALSDLVESVSVALITTVDSTGIMHTRQLPNTNSKCCDELWFLSSRDTPLIGEVRRNPKVLITYAHRGSGTYLVVNGEAAVRNDPVRARRLWHPTLASWLPGGPDDPQLVLLHVSVKSVELWD
jgi:general stress protein 26